MNCIPTDRVNDGAVPPIVAVIRNVFGRTVLMTEFATPVSPDPIVRAVVDIPVIDPVMSQGTDMYFHDTGSFDSIDISSVGIVPLNAVTST